MESTYNWYWLVDLLMEEGYKVHLANTTKIQKYSGLKYADDQHDAFWLAEMLRLGILPEGYIYPKEDRPIRDLLRKRSHLVRLRTSLILSLQNILSRNNGVKLKANDVKALTIDHVAPYLADNEDLALGRKGQQGEHRFLYLADQVTRIRCGRADRAEGAIQPPSDGTRHWQDPGPDDYAGDWSDQSICRCWEFCIVLSKGFDRLDQQREAKGQREQEERKQVLGVGILGSSRAGASI